MSVVATLLLTPMIMAAEPVRVEMVDWSYDHQTQTSTLKGDADKRIRLAFSQTQTSQRACAFCDNDWD